MVLSETQEQHIKTFGSDTSHSIILIAKDTAQAIPYTPYGYTKPDQHYLASAFNAYPTDSLTACYILGSGLRCRLA